MNLEDMKNKAKQKMDEMSGEDKQKDTHQQTGDAQQKDPAEYNEERRNSENSMP